MLSYVRNLIRYCALMSAFSLGEYFVTDVFLVALGRSDLLSWIWEAHPQTLSLFYQDKDQYSRVIILDHALKYLIRMTWAHYFSKVPITALFLKALVSLMHPKNGI